MQSHGTLFLCSDPAADAASSLKYYQSIARRLYRIFAHAYFHHREMFLEVRSQCFNCFRYLGQTSRTAGVPMQFEATSQLCEHFIEFVLKFDLIPPKLLMIPREELSKC